MGKKTSTGSIMSYHVTPEECVDTCRVDDDFKFVSLSKLSKEGYGDCTCVESLANVDELVDDEYSMFGLMLHQDMAKFSSKSGLVTGLCQQYYFLTVLSA